MRPGTLQRPQRIDSGPNMLTGLTTAGPIIPGDAMPFPDTTPTRKVDFGSVTTPLFGETYNIADDDDEDSDTDGYLFDDENIFEESPFLGIAIGKKAKRRQAAKKDARIEKRQARKLKRIANRGERKALRQNLKAQRQEISAPLEESVWDQPSSIEPQGIFQQPYMLQSQYPQYYPQEGFDFSIAGQAPFEDDSDFQDPYGEAYEYDDDIYESNFLGIAIGKKAKARKDARRKDRQATQKYRLETDRVRAKQGLAKDSVFSTAIKGITNVADALSGKSQESFDEGGGTYLGGEGGAPPAERKKDNTLLFAGIGIVVILLVFKLLKK